MDASQKEYFIDPTKEKTVNPKEKLSAPIVYN